MTRLSHTKTITLYKQQKELCYYCGTSLYIEILEGRKIELDHKDAIVNGGSNILSNLCLVCQMCNRQKGSKSEESFFMYLKPFLDGLVNRKQLSAFHKLLDKN